MLGVGCMQRLVNGRTGPRLIPDDRGGKSRGRFVGRSVRLCLWLVSRSIPPVRVFLGLHLSAPSVPFLIFLFSLFFTRLSLPSRVNSPWLRGQNRTRRQHMSFAILSSRRCAAIRPGLAWFVPPSWFFPHSRLLDTSLNRAQVVDPLTVSKEVLRERPQNKKSSFYCVRFFPKGDQ